MATLVDASRTTFLCANPAPSHEDIRTGCLQRMAEAMELMAANVRQLRADVEYWEARWKVESAVSKRQRRRIAALKGVITRLKKGKANG